MFTAAATVKTTAIARAAATEGRLPAAAALGFGLRNGQGRVMTGSRGSSGSASRLRAVRGRRPPNSINPRQTTMAAAERAMAIHTACWGFHTMSNVRSPVPTTAGSTYQPLA